MGAAAETLNPAERRKQKRADFRAAVVVAGSHGAYEAEILDLSVGGMRVRTPAAAPKIGERVTLGFQVPALDGPIEAEAYVRWVDRLDGRFCGLQFATGLRAREVWAINQVVDLLAGA